MTARICLHRGRCEFVDVVAFRTGQHLLVRLIAVFTLRQQDAAAAGIYVLALSGPPRRDATQLLRNLVDSSATHQL